VIRDFCGEKKGASEIGGVATNKGEVEWQYIIVLGRGVNEICTLIHLPIVWAGWPKVAPIDIGR
jgi:hypothetical protein